MSSPTLFVSTLELPDPYNTAEIGAWVEYGKRKVCLTLKEPGTLYRCRYSMAWLDVTETYPWRGEPLHVWGQRRPPDSDHARQSFTEAAGRSIEHDILPVVSRYGFERWWFEIHRATKGARVREESTSQRAEAERIVRYHDRRAELAEMWSDDVLDVRPVRDGETLRVEDLDYDMRWRHVDVAARLVLGDDVLGFLSRDGKLVPVMETTS